MSLVRNVLETWLSLIDPQLEARIKVREAVSQSSPDCLGPIAKGVIVWLPGLVVKIVLQPPVNLI